MVEHFLDGHDRTGRDARAVEQVDPMRRGVGGERAVDLRGQRLAMLYPMAERGEARVVLEFGPPNSFGERAPHRLVAARRC